MYTQKSTKRESRKKKISARENGFGILINQTNGRRKLHNTYSFGT
jgi:hypothetical protein